MIRVIGVWKCITFSGVGSQNHSRWRRIRQLVEWASIPDSVGEISNAYFYGAGIFPVLHLVSILRQSCREGGLLRSRTQIFVFAR